MIERIDVLVMDLLREKMLRYFLFVFVSFLIPCVSFSLLLVPEARAAAEDLPLTSITQLSAANYTTGQSLTISAQIKDGGGVEEARVYFRFQPDSKYVFMRMNPDRDNIFEAILPPIADSVKELEYFFLVVNKKHQVVRSLVYIAEKGSENGSQESVSNLGSDFLLETELPQIPDLSAWFFNPDQVRIEGVKHSEKYGLIGGVYRQDEFAEYEVHEGYFGGFLINESGETPFPVKGLLVGPPLTSAFLNEVTPDSVTSQSQAASGIIGPDIAGDSWTGFFRVYEYSSSCKCYVNISYSVPLTAVVTQKPYLPPYYDSVTITTSRSSLGHYLSGTMTDSGSMLLYDQYDGEDWTTHFGPATTTVINIYDFAQRPTEENPHPPLNAIKIFRSLPPPTVSVSATPVIINKKREVTLSWETTGADSVKIEPGIGSFAANGSIVVIPNQTTEYIVTAIGIGGTAEARVTVTVIPTDFLPAVYNLLLSK